MFFLLYLVFSDLRKLIKYDERMGIRSCQQDYYDNLFRKTTASYRAKIDKTKTTEKKVALNDILNRVERIGQTVVTTKDQHSSGRERSKSGAENKENEQLSSTSSQSKTSVLDNANDRHQRSSKKILNKYYEDWRSQRAARDVVVDNSESEEVRVRKPVAFSIEVKPPTKGGNEKFKLETSPTWKERMSPSNENLNEKHPGVREVIHDAIVEELQHQFEKTFKIDLKNKVPNRVQNDLPHSGEGLAVNMPAKKQKVVKSRTRRPATAPIYSSAIRNRTVSPHVISYNTRPQSVLSNLEINFINSFLF